MSTTPSDSPKSQRAYIRQNIQMLEDLPAPGERWRADEVTEEIAKHLTGISNQGIISQRERVEVEKFSKRRWTWETDDAAYQRIQKFLEKGDRSSLLPCGHSKIKNERGVDGITCGLCGEVHEREEVNI